MIRQNIEIKEMLSYKELLKLYNTLCKKVRAVENRLDSVTSLDEEDPIWVSERDQYATIAYSNLTYVPKTTNITINGVTYDLSQNRTWNITGYSDEQAQDAVGNILSSEFNYSDSTPLISINQIDWSKIINAPSFITSVNTVYNANDSLTSNRTISRAGFNFGISQAGVNNLLITNNRILTGSNITDNTVSELQTTGKVSFGKESGYPEGAISLENPTGFTTRIMLRPYGNVANFDGNWWGYIDHNGPITKLACANYGRLALHYGERLTFTSSAFNTEVIRFTDNLYEGDGGGGASLLIGVTTNDFTTVFNAQHPHRGFRIPSHSSTDLAKISRVIRLNVVSAGSGYTTATVNFSGGGASVQATADVILGGGGAGGAFIQTFGEGYTSAPTVTVTGDGTGMVLSPVMALPQNGLLVYNTTQKRVNIYYDLAWKKVLTEDDLISSTEWVSVPSSSSDTGTVGQKSYDSNFVYFCIATDTWIRSAIDTSW